jgi:putative tryptophan/tyrosine transport system substrate-binding protein
MAVNALRSSRRRFLQGGLALAGLGLLSGCEILPPQAQQAAKVPRIGWLSAGLSAAEFPQKQVLDGLLELGWVDGKNVLIEFRHADGDPERLSRFASEFVGLNVDLIVTFSAGVAVAKRSTETIPIVFQTSQDPVRAGFVASLARPGGNITGVTFLTDELALKRLELLKEALPAASRAAILWEPAHLDSEFKGMESAAPGLGIRLQSLEVPRPVGPDEAERAVQAARDGHAEALIVAPGGFTILHRKRIIELAAKSRLPVISAWRIFAEDGAMLTYGPDGSETSRRAAILVDKVLKGARPAELPVEQPSKFELVINLSTARALGLTIPESVLAQATEVIQ